MLAPEISGELDGQSRSYPAGQPAMTPDGNACDGGLFKPFNDRIEDFDPRKAAELTRVINTVWDGIPGRMIHDIICNVHSCILEIIRMNGGNHYKIPRRYDSEFFEVDETAAKGEQNWSDTGSYPDVEPVGYVEIPHIWPGAHMASDEEPELMPDLSSSTGNGDEGSGATSSASVMSSGIEAGGASGSAEDSDGDLGDFFDDVEEDSDLEDTWDYDDIGGPGIDD